MRSSGADLALRACRNPAVVARCPHKSSHESCMLTQLYFSADVASRVCTVYRALRERGTTTAEPAPAAATAAVMLQFPASAVRDNQLIAAFGGYATAGCVALAATAASRCPIGFSGSTPGTPQARRTDSDMPLFVPVAPHRLPLAAPFTAEAHSALSGLLMPVVPVGTGPHSVLPVQLGQTLQPLSSIGAVKPSGTATAGYLAVRGALAGSTCRGGAALRRGVKALLVLTSWLFLHPYTARGALMQRLGIWARASA